MKQKPSESDLLRRGILILCIVVFCFSAYRLIHYFGIENQSIRYYEHLAERVEIAPTPDTSSAVPSVAPSAAPGVDFETLSRENGDICGWIKLSGTVIDYPIARGKDNEKYLHHLPNGKYSYGGTLFMDCENAFDFSDFYTVIYGHNMKNKKTMFAPLMQYKKQSFLDSHPALSLTTREGTFRLSVFGAVLTDTDSIYYDFPFSGERAEALIAKIRSESLIRTETEITQADRIVALSTCDYAKEDARFIVFCKTEKSED